MVVCMKRERDNSLRFLSLSLLHGLAHCLASFPLLARLCDNAMGLVVRLLTQPTHNFSHYSYLRGRPHTISSRALRGARYIYSEGRPSQKALKNHGRLWVIITGPLSDLSLPTPPPPASPYQYTPHVVRLHSAPQLDDADWADGGGNSFFHDNHQPLSSPSSKPNYFLQSSPDPPQSQVPPTFYGHPQSRLPIFHQSSHAIIHSR
ncbi:unnamed protein product [Allacma fusca]|uniref:Uncharacterized protein n=1 Tax=Allacma fusca TaxID=39272 RepID=A0A8J2JN71_9HEXA|nr:unnamed protein product [Allacma fusca]